MEFADVVMKRRAVRRFEDGGVDREVIERIARLAQRTPSAGFSQGQRLVVVTDPTSRREVARICGEEEYEADFGPWISECAAQFIPCVSEAIYHRRYQEPDKVDENGNEIEWVPRSSRCGRTSGSPMSSCRSGSCRSAAPSPTSVHPASSAAGCRSKPLPGGNAGRRPKLDRLMPPAPDVGALHRIGGRRCGRHSIFLVAPRPSTWRPRVGRRIDETLAPGFGAAEVAVRWRRAGGHRLERAGIGAP
ncbi:MAG: nitroreductase [Chloroflexota bacterium]|nr:nitroreductase [Chloroflexota bacterium]